MSSHPYLEAAYRVEDALDALDGLDRDLSLIFGEEDECPSDLSDLWAASQRAAGRLRHLLDEMRGRVEADRQRHMEDDR